jgi:[acyl-carrier-protein] S-malonyltransferase
MTRYAVLCPGQGGQHAAMFSLSREASAAEEVLKAAHEVLGCDLEALAADPGVAYLNRTAQPLIVAAALAAWRALAPVPSPAFFAGYSVGELSAHACAGCIDLREAFSLVRERATLMSESAPHNSGLMAIRGGNLTQVLGLCAATDTHVAIINGPDRHVIGGACSALGRAEAEASRLHLKVMRLPVDVPAHTPLLQPAANAFARVLEESRIRDSQCAVVAGTNAQAVTARGEAIETLATQIAAPIDWYRCMTSLIERGCRVFLELPPGRALTQLLREQFPQVQARAVEDFRSLSAIQTWLQQRLSGNESGY